MSSWRETIPPIATASIISMASPRDTATSSRRRWTGAATRRAALRMMSPEDAGLRKDIPVPTYYPNADSPERALAVPLDSNDTRDHIDIRLLRSPSYCVAGAADLPRLGVSSPKRPSSSGLIDPAPSYGGARGVVGPDGKFRICGSLHPGEYSLFLELTRTLADGRGRNGIRDRRRSGYRPRDRYTSGSLAYAHRARVVWGGRRSQARSRGGISHARAACAWTGISSLVGVSRSAASFRSSFSPLMTSSQVEDAAIRVNRSSARELT